MKKMNAEKKRKLAGVIAIVLIASMLLSAIVPAFLSIANAATTSSDYTIEADLGFDGMAKIGTDIPVNINVTNNSSQNFSGEVAVYAATYAYGESIKYIKYSEKAEIAALGSKSVYFNVPINLIQRSVTVQLCDKKGEVAEENISLSVGSGDDCWIGILSDDYDSVSYINPVSNRQNGCTVDLKKAMSNTNAVIPLEAFNVFVIDNFNMEALSEDYLRAIRGRIAEGALLLVGDDVAIDTDAMTEVNEISDYNLRTATDIDALRSYNYFYRLGKGYVIKTGLDLSNASRVSSDVNFTSLFAYLCTDSVTDGTNDIEDNLIGITDSLPNLTDNTIKVIVSVLYVYILFFPVLYFVLKRKDKREEALKIIPITALVGSLVIYLLSFNTVYKKPIANVINYFDLRAVQGNEVNVLSCMNLVSPSKGSITVVPEGKPEVLSVSEKNYSNDYYSTKSSANFNGDEDIAAEIIRDTDSVSIKLRDKTKWSSTFLRLSDTYKLDGELTSSVDMSYDGTITGTITNNTGIDFEKAVFVVSSGSEIIYASKVDDFNAADSINLAEYGINPITADSSYNSYRWIISDDGDTLGKSDKAYRFELEQDILNEVCSDIISSSGTDNGIKLTVLGFSGEALYGEGIKLNKTSVNGSYTNVFRAESELSYQSNLVTGQNGYYNDTNASQQRAELESDVPFTVESENVLEYAERLEIVYPDEYVDISFDASGLDKQGFVIMWDSTAEEMYIYNSESKLWETLSCGMLYDTDSYLSDGKILIKAADFAETYIGLPAVRFY